MFNEKTGNVIFLAENDLSLFLSTYEFFQIFSNFWKPRLSKNVSVVFANRFDRLSRKFLSAVRSRFAKESKFCDLKVFSK